MPEGKNEILESVKSVGQEVITTFGLVELVLGGVGLYGLWLLFRPERFELFPKTGYDFMDVGLLAFAAVVVGKLIYLLSSVVMGFVLVTSHSAKRKLSTSLESYIEVSGLGSADLRRSLLLNPAQPAELMLSSSSVISPQLKNNRNRVLIAYGSAFASVPYVIYGFIDFGGLGAVVSVLAAVFVFLGYAEQQIPAPLYGESTGHSLCGAPNKTGY